jgi:hypothetical protein
MSSKGILVSYCMFFEMIALRPSFEATKYFMLVIKIQVGRLNKLSIKYPKFLQNMVG